MWNGPLFSLAAHLARAVWRGWRARPGIALLNIAGIAIGVAVYLAIQIVNHSATRSFQAGLDLVAGRSHLEVTAGKGGLDETCWPSVAAIPGVAACSGVVEGYATVPSHPGEYLRIVGVDLFSAAPFQVAAAAGASWRDDPEAWMAEGGKLVISTAMAERLGRKAGDPLEIRTAGRTATVTIAAVAPDEGEGVTRIGFMDIGWAQELLDCHGRLSSLQIICTTPQSADAVAAAIAPVLPQGARVEPPERRNRQVGLMLQGFQLNLTALSLVSLLVGVFLTGSTIAASVVRQRREIGILRAVGASQGQVRGLFLAEALIAALAGGLLAVPLARWLAGSLLGAVSQTISAHYVQMSIDRSYLSWWHVAQAVGCGVAAALAGAWLPAREASGTDPVRALQPGRGIEARRTLPRAGKTLAAAGLGLCLALGLSWQSLHGGPPWLSFGGCLFLVLSFVLLARPATRFVAMLAARAAARGDAVLLRLGAEHLERSLHRAAPVVAALLTAVAMVLGVSIMIHSFRGTLELWVNGTLRADLYIAPAANEVVRHSDTIPDGLVGFLQNQPETASVETLTEEPVTLADGNEYMLRAVSRAPDHPLPFMGRHPDAASKAWFQPGHVAVSEILAARIGAQSGDILSLPTPDGPRPFTVAGVFYDYADDRGCLYITEPSFAAHWPDRRHHAVAVFLKNPAAAAPLEEAIRRAFSKSGELSTFQNQRLRDRVFTIFDQTFAVTGLLRIVAIAVAVLGIAMALSTLVAERRREIAALRSIGSSKSQIAGIHLSEAGLIGLTAALLGMICGILLAMILTWVVNRAFFGWTVRFSLPWQELLLTPLWVTASAVLAGLIPAWHAAGAEPAEALRAT
jgi:putative ABC transport system permease protein